MWKEFLNSCKKRSKILKMEFFVSFIHRRRTQTRCSIDFSLSSTVSHSLEIFPIAVHPEKVSCPDEIGTYDNKSLPPMNSITKIRIKSRRKRFNDGWIVINKNVLILVYYEPTIKKINLQLNEFSFNLDLK